MNQNNIGLSENPSLQWKKAEGEKIDNNRLMLGSPLHVKLTYSRILHPNLSPVAPDAASTFDPKMVKHKSPPQAIDVTSNITAVTHPTQMDELNDDGSDCCDSSNTVPFYWDNTVKFIACVQA